MTTVFIAGAAGTAGRSYARAFASAGHTVRAGVRPGAGAVVDADVVPWPADLHDADARRAAVEGCDVVVISLAGRGVEAAADEGALTMAVAEAAAAAGVRHLIYTSVHLADAATGVPHFDIKGSVEPRLSRLIERVTVLRPTTFAESLTAPWLRSSIERDGVLLSPIAQHAEISYVPTDHLAAVAVAALEQPELQGPPVVVSADRPVTYAELLPLFSELTGREVTYQQMPLDVVRTGFGADLVAMTELFNRHGFTAQTSPVLHRLGLLPPTVHDHLRHAWAPEAAGTPTPSGAR